MRDRKERERKCESGAETERNEKWGRKRVLEK